MSKEQTFAVLMVFFVAFLGIAAAYFKSGDDDE